MPNSPFSRFAVRGRLLGGAVMAAPTFPAIAASRESGLSEAARVREVRFGDGYAQSAADGLNAVVRTFRAVFAARTRAEIDTIRTFLRARAGHEPFLFTPPGASAAIKWRCREWSETRTGATHRTLTAFFVEDFTP